MVSHSSLVPVTTSMLPSLRTTHVLSRAGDVEEEAEESDLQRGGPGEREASELNEGRRPAKDAEAKRSVPAMSMSDAKLGAQHRGRIPREGRGTKRPPLVATYLAPVAAAAAASGGSARLMVATASRAMRSLLETHLARSGGLERAKG